MPSSKKKQKKPKTNNFDRKKPPKKLLFQDFFQFLPHNKNFCWKVSSKIIYNFYLKHQKYPFCAPIFQPISETESYPSWWGEGGGSNIVGSWIQGPQISETLLWTYCTALTKNLWVHFPKSNLFWTPSKHSEIA